jgi:uncharacterized membrane protein
MDFTAQALPSSYLFAGWACFAWLAWRIFATGAWRVLTDPALRTRFLVAVAVLVALWQVRTGVKPGLELHLYGVAALTLMFGYWRAVLAGMLALGIAAALGRSSVMALGTNAVLTVAFPAWVSWQVLRLLDKRLPRHFFVYALGNGFFGAAASVAVMGLGITAVMALSGAYTPAYLFANYTPYATLLISWAEAFSTGMAITVMAVYRPAWLATYDETRMLRESDKV